MIPGRHDQGNEHFENPDQSPETRQAVFRVSKQRLHTKAILILILGLFFLYAGFCPHPPKFGPVEWPMLGFGLFLLLGNILVLRQGRARPALTVDERGLQSGATFYPWSQIQSYRMFYYRFNRWVFLRLKDPKAPVAPEKKSLAGLWQKLSGGAQQRAINISNFNASSMTIKATLDQFCALAARHERESAVHKEMD